jgi:hypothetical protein
MPRLAIALCTLLTLNLTTTGLRWLFVTHRLPWGQTLSLALACVGILALTYVSTLEASPLYYLYQKEAKIYALSGLVGCLLGLF